MHFTGLGRHLLKGPALQPPQLTVCGCHHRCGTRPVVEQSQLAEPPPRPILVHNAPLSGSLDGQCSERLGGVIAAAVIATIATAAGAVVREVQLVCWHHADLQRAFVHHKKRITRLALLDDNIPGICMHEQHRVEKRLLPLGIQPCEQWGGGQGLLQQSHLLCRRRSGNSACAQRDGRAGVSAQNMPSREMQPPRVASREPHAKLTSSGVLGAAVAVLSRRLGRRIIGRFAAAGAAAAADGAAACRRRLLAAPSPAEAESDESVSGVSGVSGVMGDSGVTGEGEGKLFTASADVTGADATLGAGADPGAGADSNVGAGAGAGAGAGTDVDGEAPPVKMAGGRTPPVRPRPRLLVMGNRDGDAALLPAPRRRRPASGEFFTLTLTLAPACTPDEARRRAGLLTTLPGPPGVLAPASPAAAEAAFSSASSSLMATHVMLSTRSSNCYEEEGGK